jgi:hypothetical protein
MTKGSPTANAARRPPVAFTTMTSTLEIAQDGEDSAMVGIGRQ